MTAMRLWNAPEEKMTTIQADGGAVVISGPLLLVQLTACLEVGEFLTYVLILFLAVIVERPSWLSLSNSL